MICGIFARSPVFRIAEMLVRADQDMYAVKEDMKGYHE